MRWSCVQKPIIKKPPSETEAACCYKLRQTGKLLHFYDRNNRSTVKIRAEETTNSNKVSEKQMSTVKQMKFHPGIMVKKNPVI